MSAARRRVVLLLVALALLLPVGVHAATRSTGPAASDAAAPAAPSSGVTPDPERSPAAPPLAVQGAPATGVEPVRVTVPRIGVDVAVEHLRTDATGRLESPRGWQRAGWFAEGAAPGEIGPAVVAGHVDSPTGPAAFTGLDALGAGDEITVERADGSVVRFEVDRTEVVAKGEFPTAAVYGATPDRQLRLITCDGPYVRGSGGYQDNLVVFASAVGP